MNQKSQSVFITGCSSGIGAACALDLSQRGLRVFGGVRKTADADRLRTESGGRVEPILVDVTDDGAIAAAAATLRAALGDAGLGALINNAGILVPGPLELVSRADFERQLQVNVLGPHAVTKALLPMLRQSPGRIVLVGSITCRVTPPYYGAYAASKHALEAMAAAWRMELRRWGIRVSLVQPDSVVTPIWNKLESGVGDLERQTAAEENALYADELRQMCEASLRSGESGLPVRAVVKAIRHAVCARWPRTHYPVGFRTRSAFWGQAHLPATWMDRFMRRAMGLR